MGHGNGNEAGGCRGGGRKKCNRPAKVLFLDQYRWRKAGRILRQKLGEFAADPVFSDEMARARQLYLADINPHLVDENDEILMERCFEWFIFDYVMEDGETLIDIYSSVSNISAMEKKLIGDWSGSRMSVFEVCAISGQKGLRIRDLILSRKFTVNNYAVSGKLEKGSVIFMRVLRVGNEHEFSTGGLALPPDCGKPLIMKIKADLDRYAARSRRKSFSLDRYLRDRAHKINAWMLDFALNPPDPAGQSQCRPAHSMSSLIAQRITDLFLDDYYEKWINRPVQALDGKTPRESCKTVEGRAKVEDLLKELEIVEMIRIKKGEPYYDINKVRTRLGLIPGNRDHAVPGEIQSPPAAPARPGYKWATRAQAEVALMIKKDLKAKNYSPIQIEGALKLWSDYCDRENPGVRKEKLWLAAVVYTLARLEFNGNVPQHKVADEYGVSPSSLSEKYRSICKSLDLVVFDRRYTSVKSPIGN